MCRFWGKIFVLGLPSWTLTTLSEERRTFRCWLQFPCRTIHKVADFNNDHFFQTVVTLRFLRIFALHPVAPLCQASDLLTAKSQTSSLRHVTPQRQWYCKESEDGDRFSCRNVVCIRHTSDCGQCPTKLGQNESTTVRSLRANTITICRIVLHGQQQAATSLTIWSCPTRWPASRGSEPRLSPESVSWTSQPHAVSTRGIELKQQACHQEIFGI